MEKDNGKWERVAEKTCDIVDNAQKELQIKMHKKQKQILAKTTKCIKAVAVFVQL